MEGPLEEEEEEEESYYQIYRNFMKARNDANDDNFTDALHQYDDLADDISKLNYLNTVMLNDQYELFECLLRLRKDDILSLEDDKESTLVHYMAMNNHPAFVYILACLREKDDDIELDEPNYYNQTPIMLACTYGHEDVLEVRLSVLTSTGLTQVNPCS